jgi:hypothetical protein
VAELHSPSDEALLTRLQHAAFDYFLQATNPANGLVADTTRKNSPSSIAVVGFALSVYPVAVERGWLSRADAAERVLVTLRYFWKSAQHDGPDATGFKGLYYHFLHMETGARVWQSELSMMDSALFLAGALTASAYFTATSDMESEIRDLADALYHRADWRWAQNEGDTILHGWKRECGFLHYGWEGYNEALILYVLALGSPTFAPSEASFPAWTLTYQWENIYGYDLLYAGPLFVHQYSHAWIDFRSIKDRFMREKSSDYFENSRRAIQVQREYAMRNPRGFEGYGENCWGFSAGDGPGTDTLRMDGNGRLLFGYAARGAPYGPDDGTIAPSAAVASLPFSPEHVLPAVRHLYERCGTDNRLPSGFNLTLADSGPRGWISEGYFGLDQGIIVLMIENYRSQLIWRLMRECDYIKEGLRRAGFTGGWL